MMHVSKSNLSSPVDAKAASLINLLGHYACNASPINVLQLSDGMFASIACS